MNLNIPTTGRVEFSKCRPNCVVMSKRLLMLLGRSKNKARRMRPIGVRYLRTRVRRGVN